MSKKLFCKYCVFVAALCLNSILVCKAQRNISNTKNLSFEYGFMNHNPFVMFFNDRLEFKTGLQLEYANSINNIWSIGISADQKWSVIGNINSYERFYTMEATYGQLFMVGYSQNFWLKPNLGISLGARDRPSKLSFAYGLMASINLQLFISDKLALFARPHIKYFFEINKIQLPLTFGLTILDI